MCTSDSVRSSGEAGGYSSPTPTRRTVVESPSPKFRIKTRGKPLGNISLDGSGVVAYWEHIDSRTSSNALFYNAVGSVSRSAVGPSASPCKRQRVASACNSVVKLCSSNLSSVVPQRFFACTRLVDSAAATTSRRTCRTWNCSSWNRNVARAWLKCHFPAQRPPSHRRHLFLRRTTHCP